MGFFRLRTPHPNPSPLKKKKLLKCLHPLKQYKKNLLDVCWIGKKNFKGQMACSIINKNKLIYSANA